jgi:hypothetical protein
MTEQVEISSLDLRYESCRMKSKQAEKQLLDSILDNGIRDALRGVETKQGSRILLDGFKRYRCAQKLNMGMLPYHSLSDDEALGIIELLRISNAKSLCILEQAGFVDELKSVHNMSTSEIAELLERSKAWVSVRSGIIREMGAYVRDQIFKGRFPVYSYMYTLRQFMRINACQSDEVEEFVRSVAGKNLSIRSIEALAYGYFKGSDAVREQIRSGHIPWALKHLKQTHLPLPGCSQVEAQMIRDLEIVSKYMQRVSMKVNNPKYKTKAFFAQANLLTGGILRQTDSFLNAIREFHDRSGQT